MCVGGGGGGGDWATSFHFYACFLDPLDSAFHVISYWRTKLFKKILFAYKIMFACVYMYIYIIGQKLFLFIYDVNILYF